jgi:hypothetical protein
MKWKGNIIEPDGCSRKSWKRIGRERKSLSQKRWQKQRRSKKMADEIFQAVLKDMKESKNEQAVPQGPPDVCLCRMHV